MQVSSPTRCSWPLIFSSMTRTQFRWERIRCSISRSVATWRGSFNHHFGETFVLPKAKILEASAKVPGVDGEKMSKSYDNTLEIFEEPKPAAQEDHAHRDGLAAHGGPQGAGRRSPLPALLAVCGTMPSGRRWPPSIAGAGSDTAR